jgi:hypothetical protein
MTFCFLAMVETGDVAMRGACSVHQVLLASNIKAGNSGLAQFLVEAKAAFGVTSSSDEMAAWWQSPDCDWEAPN